MTATVVVRGVGASLPARVVSNDDLTSQLDTSDEWIRRRTGIRTRRWVEPGVATSDLAVDAGARAMRSAGLAAVDAVIVATTTPDRLCPATAPEVAARLGLVGIPAHDIAAVCTGFLYGLANAVGLIASRVADTVLLIGAETFSTIIDPADRGTAVIFGDGAGAVVLAAGQPGEANQLGEVGPCVLGSDGSQSDLIQIPAGGARQRSTGASASAADYFFQMSGREVFRLGVERMTIAAQDAIKRSGLAYDEIDFFVPHQANKRISDTVAKHLDIDQSKVLSNIETVGNTAAASIPVLLAEAAGDGRLRPGHRLLLVAFGGGLTWGATTMTWPDITSDTGYLAPARD